MSSIKLLINWFVTKKHVTQKLRLISLLLIKHKSLPPPKMQLGPYFGGAKKGVVKGREQIGCGPWRITRSGTPGKFFHHTL